MALVAATGLTAASREYLGYHTTEQVRSRLEDTLTREGFSLPQLCAEEPTKPSPGVQGSSRCLLPWTNWMLEHAGRGLLLGRHDRNKC